MGTLHGPASLATRWSRAAQSFVATDHFAVTALAVHLLLALTLRVTAWPEVTTPGYLWSRGMLMYRDIKWVHTPGTAGSLAIAFWLFGPRTWLVRAFAILWPLIAHASLLRETRRFPTWNRILTSAFFLVVFFSSEGNAVWATVVMAALTIPVARALSAGRMWTAGLLFGVAILSKQTAAYALLLAVACLLARRRRREARVSLAGGCIPYFLALAVFALLGAGADMWRWTVIVPFTVTEPWCFGPAF